MSTARPSPGWRRPTTATTALAGRENDCFSGTPPLNPGLFHTGCGGGPNGQGEKVIFGLTTSIQSIGEGNYGRLGAGQQQRYTHALAETMFSEPATGGTPDEQPGAMPEIFPSPDQGANIDRCWTCRSMFMQAWGNYGTAWAVVHQWLGVRPDLGHGRIDVRAAGAAGPDLGAGTGHPARATGPPTCAPPTPATATVRRSTPPGVGAEQVVIGHTLPRGTQPARSCSTGRPVHNYLVRETNRGTEVTVSTGCRAPHADRHGVTAAAPRRTWPGPRAASGPGEPGSVAS